MKQLSVTDTKLRHVNKRTIKILHEKNWMTLKIKQ